MPGTWQAWPATAELLERRRLLSVAPFKFTYTDHDGDIVTVSLAGGGSAEIVPDALPQLNITDTAAESILNVSVKKAPGGDGCLTLARVWSTGPLKAISAAKVNVSGVMLLNTNEGDVTGDAVSIRLGALDNTSADTHNLPVKAMTVLDWRNSDPYADSFTTPWIGKLAVSGRRGKTGSLRGDLDADITLIGQDPGGTSLGKLTVAGVWTGDLQAQGNLGTLQVRMNMASSQVRTSGSIQSITIGHDMADSRLQATGSLGTVTVSSLVGSQVLVGVASDFADVFASSAGDFANPGATLGALRVRTPRSKQPAYVQEVSISAPQAGTISWVNAQPWNCQVALLANTASQTVVKVVNVVPPRSSLVWHYGQADVPVFVTLLQ